MSPKLRQLVLKLLKQTNLMSIATQRPDGWPQVTTVTYANDGLAIYFCCDPDSQKARNISRNRKVSATIDRDYADWNKVRGLSLAGAARVLKRVRDIEHGLKLLRAKFPQFRAMGEIPPDEIAVVRVDPKIFSVIDYTRGFGHTDLVRV